MKPSYRSALAINLKQVSLAHRLLFGRLLSTSLFLVAGQVSVAQTPTPLGSGGAQVYWSSLANPAVPDPATTVIARYQDCSDGGYLAKTSPSPTIAPGGGCIRVNEVLVGDSVPSGAEVLQSMTLTSDQAIAAGADPARIQELIQMYGYVTFSKSVWRLGAGTAPAAP